MSQSTLRFDGADYVPSRDRDRLETQFERVRRVMLDGKPRTIPEIAALTGDPENSVAAQCRNLRKKENGSHDVRKRHRGEPSHGLYEYFINLQAPSSPALTRAASVSTDEVLSGRREFRAETARAVVLPDFACPCGQATAAKHCKCGVVWCSATGHVRHKCGVSR